MKPSPFHLLPLAALATALAAGLAPALGADVLPAPAVWHLVFAVGALPMILAAMAYFTPVLTRSGEPPAALSLAPLAALGAGLAIIAHFHHGNAALRLWAPWGALAAVGTFAAWMLYRRRRCLGHPNPCLNWYLAALGMLVLGLAAVAAASQWPQHAGAARRFHLHINTLGFMGLTALGTLQVLLPTVAGHPDADAADRLHRDLPWSIGGTLAIAGGAAIAPPLAVFGLLAYAWPVAHLLHATWQQHRSAICASGTVLPLLFAALAGLTLALAHGAGHAVGATDGRGDIALFALAFLLPLVSGAAGQLLPVWLAPGAQGEWHRTARRRLALGARLRAVLLPLAGLLTLAGWTAGYALALFCAGWLALAMARVVVSR